MWPGNPEGCVHVSSGLLRGQAMRWAKAWLVMMMTSALIGLSGFTVTLFSSTRLALAPGLLGYIFLVLSCCGRRDWAVLHRRTVPFAEWAHGNGLVFTVTCHWGVRLTWGQDGGDMNPCQTGLRDTTCIICWCSALFLSSHVCWILVWVKFWRRRAAASMLCALFFFCADTRGLEKHRGRCGRVSSCPA